MHDEPRSNPAHELGDLLTRLARFFSENESVIQTREVLACFQRLAPTESSALKRLFSLSCLSRRAVPQRGGDLGRAKTVVEDNVVANGTLHSHQSHTTSPTRSRGPVRQAASPGANDVPRTPADIDSTNALVPTPDQSNRTNSHELSFSQQSSSYHQPDVTMGAELANSESCQSSALRDELSELQTSDSDDTSLGNTQLASCSDLTFAPSTHQLLEECKASPSEFLRAIREARASFPTGQGWKAAIASKKENADMRELMRIYHRFECHNIYSHVVEAGFHTGSRWIREMRTDLARKLCQEFPKRFQSHSAANKCLNWVDQGCRYHEWAEMFGEPFNLGYLIALPTTVPHSAYTSRCTREQMNAGAAQFKRLGICELVRGMQLSSLGSYIANELREMTSNKSSHIGEDAQDSRKTPRLGPYINVITTANYDQNTMPPKSFAASDDSEMQDQDACSFSWDSSIDSEVTMNNYYLVSNGYPEIFMDDQVALTMDEWFRSGISESRAICQVGIASQ